MGLSPDLIDAVELLVSELLTNSVQALAAGLADPDPDNDDEPIELVLRLLRDRLVVEVYDTHPHVPTWRPASAESEHGRGLMLVAALAREWGSAFAPDGRKVVWTALSPIPA